MRLQFFVGFFFLKKNYIAFRPQSNRSTIWCYAVFVSFVYKRWAVFRIVCVFINDNRICCLMAATPSVDSILYTFHLSESTLAWLLPFTWNPFWWFSVCLDGAEGSECFVTKKRMLIFVFNRFQWIYSVNTIEVHCCVFALDMFKSVLCLRSFCFAPQHWWLLIVITFRCYQKCVN